MKTLIFNSLCVLFLLQLVATGTWANNSNDVEQLKEQLKNTDTPDKRIELLHKISNQLAHSNFERSVEYAEESLQIAIESNDKKNIVESNNLLGKLYLEAGRKEEALEKIETAAKIAKEEKLKELEAKSSIILGYYWYRLGDSIGTISNYERGFDLYTELGDNEGIARSSMKLGWGYDIYGDYEQAESYFQKAIHMEDQITDTTLIINVLSGMGAFYINKSIKQHQAIQYFERALKLAQSINDRYNIGRTYNALGFLYSSLNNGETAKSFYSKGLKIFKELNNKTEICWLYTQIGELYSDEKEFDTALDYFEKALDIVDSLDRSVMHRAEVYLAIGLVHRGKGEYDKALDFFSKSLELSKGSQNNHHIMNSELAIGVCHVAMNNLVEGKKWCELAFDKVQKHLVLSQEACDCLYKASQGLGDYKSALLYHEKLKVLSDSLHNEELSEEINNLAAKQTYEMELANIQKTREIEAANIRTKSITTIGIISFLALLIIMLLLLSIVKKTEQKKQLQALSIVRKEMIANVSHDLRTPITVMIGYVETLLLRVGKTNIADQKKYLEIILNSAERLSQLIGQLFEYSKLEAQQIKPNKEYFQLADLVKETFSRYQIIAEKKEIKINMKCSENIPVVYADVILIERVIQNLMDNALKFTPQHGSISVCLSNQKEQVQVEIKDTGKGISKEKEQLIFERYEKSKSSTGAGLGLTIVKNILDMHGSRIQVNSQLNQGTKFIFSLPTD